MSSHINCLTAFGVVSSFKCFVVYRKAFRSPSVSPFWSRRTFIHPFTSTLLPVNENRWCYSIFHTWNRGIISFHDLIKRELWRLYLLQMPLLDEYDRTRLLRQPWLWWWISLFPVAESDLEAPGYPTFFDIPVSKVIC